MPLWRAMAGPMVGDPAPAFALPSSDGTTVALADLLPGPLVLYFYPRDFTAGCTAEACGFQERVVDGDLPGARVIGISADPPDRHEAFRDKHGLTFQLLSDEDRTVAKAYGASGLFGTSRVTFVLDAKGVIVARIASQRPDKHITGALEALGKEVHA